MSLPSRCLMAAVALGAVGAAAPASATTLDVLYCYPSFARFHEPVAEMFMAAQSEIVVEFQAPCASYDDGHQQVLRSAVTNQLPDVYYAGFHLLAELAQTLEARGQIVDLGPLLEAEGEAFVDTNFESRMVELGKVNGTQYGLAFNASSPIMYFNQELVEQAGGDPDAMPENWEDLLDLAAQINALGDDIQGIAYDVHGWPDDWLWQAAIYQQGGQLVDREKLTVGFDEAIGLQALQYFRRLVTEGGMQLIDWDQSRQQFGAGQTGILFTTPAHLNQVTGMVGDRFTLGTARFPLDDQEQGGVPTGGNAVVILTNDPEKQEAAWEFVKYVTGPEAQTVVVEMTGYLPTNRRAMEDDYLGPFYTANPNFRTAPDQIDRALPWEGYPGGQSVRIWRAQRDVIGDVMRGAKSPEDGLAELIEVTESMMR